MYTVYMYVYIDSNTVWRSHKNHMGMWNVRSPWNAHSPSRVTRVISKYVECAFTVSDAIVRSWLWLTATRSSPLGYFSKLLQVVDN